MLIECKRCGQLKDVSHFNKVSNRKRGYHVWCKECLKEYDHNRHLAQHDKIMNQKYKRRHLIHTWLIENKKNLYCVKCGENDPCCLEFHHLNPSEKEFNISDAIKNGYSIKRIELEMKKCIVLCSNCHKKEHANNKEEIDNQLEFDFT